MLAPLRAPRPLALGPETVAIAAVGAGIVIGSAIGLGQNKGFALLIGLLFTPLALINLPLAVAFWVPLVFLPPIALVGVGPTAAAFVVVLAWLGTLGRGGQALALLRFHLGRIGLVLALLVWVTISISWLRDPALGLADLWLWWFAGVAFVVLITTAREPKHARWLCYAFVAGAALSVFAGFLDQSFVSATDAYSIDADARRRLGALLTDPNYLAAGIVPAVVIAIGLVTPRKPIASAALLGTVALLIVGFGATESRGGLVAAAVAVIGAFLFYRGRRGYVFVFLALVLAMAAAWFSVNPDAWSRITSFDGAGNGRSALWEVAWRMTEDNPVAGVGLDNFVNESSRYVSRPGSLEAVALVVEQPHVVHNLYLQYLAETGVVGLGLYLLVLLGSIRAAWVASKRFDAAGDRRMGALAQSVTVALISIAAASVFISNGSDVRLWILLALGPILLACSRGPDTGVRQA